MTRPVVFVGPSLSEAKVLEILPNARVRPPVRLGDLYGLRAEDTGPILIIDGVFHGTTPVWQREILSLLQTGRTVAGAASMGALRALELAPYGMLGVGQIVAWYRDGIIEGDDEVALLHADADMGYMALSIPLVDLRYGMQRAIGDGVVTQTDATRVIGDFKRRAHSDRTRKALDDVLATYDMPATALAPYIGAAAPSLKAQDASALLSAARSTAALRAAAVIGTEPRWSKPAPNPTTEPILLRAVRRNDGTTKTLAQLVSAAAHAEPDVTARRVREASRRWFLRDWSDRTGWGPSRTDVQAWAQTALEDQARKLGLTPEQWLESSALRREDLTDVFWGLAFEAWLHSEDASDLDVLRGDDPFPAIPRILRDWAHRVGAAPPDADDLNTGQIATWVVQSTPAYFGAVTWHPDVAVALAMCAEGNVAETAIGHPHKALHHGA